jgi:hypothetical protein
MPKTLACADVVLIVVTLGLLLQRCRDRRRLRRFVQDIDLSRLDTRQIVLAIARRCHALPFRRDPTFCPRLFGSLGATPSAVIRLGGCCSDRSRLLILALAELDIRAYQITLYHRAGHAQHCLVEVCLGDERLIVDPTYGLCYADADGAAMTLEALQRGRSPVYVPLMGGGACQYPRNAYYDFDFRTSKTANWTKSLARRLTYRGLRALGGGAVDRLEVPAVLEWPQHLAIAIATVGAAVVHIAMALIAAR